MQNFDVLGLCNREDSWQGFTVSGEVSGVAVHVGSSSVLGLVHIFCLVFGTLTLNPKP